MRIAYVLKLALKNLQFHRLRSFLTVGAVAIGVGFTIFLISLGSGLQMVGVEQIADLESIRVLDVTCAKAQKRRIDDHALKKFESFEDVAEVAPQASVGAKIEYKTSIIDGVVYGKNPSLVHLEGMDLQEGKIYSSDYAKEALVTVSALRMLGFKDYKTSLGKNVVLKVVIPAQLVSGNGNKSIEKTQYCKIVGVLKDDKAPYAYVPLGLLKKHGVAFYSDAKVKVNEADRIEVVKKQIEKMDYEVETAKGTLEQANQVFDILKLALSGFGMIAVFVACIGMLNTMTISLLERSREIGMMKAIGAKRKDVQQLFLAEALCISTIGSVAGLILAVLAGEFINIGIDALARMTGNQPVRLFQVAPLLLVVAVLFAMIVSFFTGYYPARRAAHTNPLDALRYE